MRTATILSISLTTLCLAIPTLHATPQDYSPESDETPEYESPFLKRIKSAHQDLKPVTALPKKPQAFMGLDPTLLKSARAGLSPTQTQRFKSPSPYSDDLITTRQKLKPANLARKKTPFDPRVNSLARYYEANNTELNELARKRYAVSEHTALENARDLEHDINPLHKAHAITADYIKQITAFLEQQTKGEALAQIEAERKAVHVFRRQRLEDLRKLLESDAFKCACLEICALALEREKRLQRQAQNFLQHYTFDSWRTAIIHHVFPAVSLRNPTISFSSLVIEDFVLDWHHQEVLNQAENDLAQWRDYMSNLIYNHNEDIYSNRRKAEWEIVKILSAEQPSQSELEQAYMYIKLNCDQGAQNTGTEADYDAYSDMLFSRLLSTAAYPDVMMRNHNNFIFELKQHFAKGNPLDHLKKTFIASVLRPAFIPVHRVDSAVVSFDPFNSLISPFMFDLIPQSGPAFQTGLLVAAEEDNDDVTPSALNRFPAINAAKILQESGTYKPLKVDSFESNITNSSAHQLALAERTFTIKESLLFVSRSFSFTAIGSTAGFIYVPGNSPKNATPQTLRAFFTTTATYDVHGGTLRPAWTEAKESHETMVLETHEHADSLNPEGFYAVPADISLESTASQ
jgi:hypothetical protein